MSLFFYNASAPPGIYTLSLHDALPIFSTRPAGLTAWSYFGAGPVASTRKVNPKVEEETRLWINRDRKSTRLNSSHVEISYAVFCLKKKTAAPAGGHGMAGEAYLYALPT